MLPISPRVDIAFKKIFGVEENKDLLISLINSIVSEEDKVASVTLLNPYNPKNFKNDKLSILDIKAQGETGKRFNIEIQITDEADYDKRALYYWAKLYTEQLGAGQDYSNLTKAIGIHILNFTSIVENDKYHNVFHVKEKETGEPYFTDLELHTIELKKFMDRGTSQSIDKIKFLAKIQTALDLWVAFLTRHDLLNQSMSPKGLKGLKGLEINALKKALGVLEVMNFSAHEREAYEGHLKWMRIEATTLKKAEERAEARGEARGEATGEIRGVEKVVINMFRKNMALDVISKATNLSIEAILEICKSQPKL